MFPRDYFDARDRFRRLAGDRLESLPISARGPRGELLSIDIAWLGERTARRIVLVTSGLHGIEGFAGSAVQCSLLAARPLLSPGCALVLMHALNPWGFAHGRRVNERNVDLNRNFHVVAAYAQRMPTLYAALDPLLNPASAPRPDAFLLRAAGYVLRYGVRACRQAIAEGQDAFPRGLFYGGRELEEGPRRVLDWLRGHLAGAQRLLVLDLHTGLGRFGQQTLLAEPDMPHERVASLAHALGAHARGGAGRSDPGGFAAHATFAAALAPTLGHVQPEFFTVEYGTYSGLRVLYALREENRWHHYGDGSLSHAVKARLAETFAPASARWRSAAVSNGDRLLRAAAAAIAREDFATL